VYDTISALFYAVNCGVENVFVMKILVLNGPNLNMLGIRERAIYGAGTYADLVDFIKTKADALGVDVEIKQSNHEGVLVDWVQEARGVYDAIVINAAAYTHTSLAILDALKAVSLPVAEVHLSEPKAREEFRHFSYISLVAEKVFSGEGFKSYEKAIEYFALAPRLS
jgi:3-dehydroquinate dehydratase-2